MFQAFHKKQLLENITNEENFINNDLSSEYIGVNIHNLNNIFSSLTLIGPLFFTLY